MNRNHVLERQNLDLSNAIEDIKTEFPQLYDNADKVEDFMRKHKAYREREEKIRNLERKVSDYESILAKR